MLAFDHVLAAGAAVTAGGYISLMKVIPPLALLFIWARLVSWADEDARVSHLPRTILNIANVIALVIGFGVFFLLPTFILALLGLLAVMGADVGIYLFLRNKEVGLSDLQGQVNKIASGIKEKGTPSKGKAAGRTAIMGKDGKPLPVPDSDSPDRPSYDAVQSVLSDPISRGASQIDITPEGENMAVRATIDTYPHKSPDLARAVGADLIAYMKWAGGLSLEERRKPQTATLKATIDGEKHELKIQTAGTTAGEHLRVIVDPKIRHSFKLPELGFSDAQRKVVEDLIQDRSGIVLLSAPKGHGLTSLLYTLIRSHDIFMEHAQTIEHDQEQDIEGVTQNKLAPNASAAEEFKLVDWAISQEPHILGVSRVTDPRCAASLAEFGKSGKRAYVCLRANSTFEAIEQWKRLAGSSGEAIDAVKLVINSRVIRKLCPACKEGFAPDPATLKKLGMTADRVSTLYKAREQPIKDSRGNPVPCEFCKDLRYKGRVGVYETLVIDSELRQVLDAGKPMNQAFRKQRGRYMQEEALALVEHGETSVQEVLRVLKPVAEGAAAAPPTRTAAAPTRR